MKMMRSRYRDTVRERRHGHLYAFKADAGVKRKIEKKIKTDKNGEKKRGEGRQQCKSSSADEYAFTHTYTSPALKPNHACP